MDIILEHYMIVLNSSFQSGAILGVANDKYETARDGETSIFLCEPEKFWHFKLRDRDFNGFDLRAQDVQTFKIWVLDLAES